MSRMDLIGRSSSLVRTSPFRPYTPKDSFRKSPPLNSSATKTKIASADKDADPGTLAYYFQNKDSKPEKNEIEEPKELSVSPIKRRASLKRKVIVDDDDEEDEVKVESKSEKKLTALKSENIFSYGTLISKDSAKLTPEAPRVRKIRPSLDREVVEEMHNSVHLSKEVEADNAKRTPTSIEDGQLKLSKFFVNRTSRSPIVQKNSVIQPKNQETLHSHLFQASTSGQQLYAKMNKRRFGLKNLGNTCYMNSVLQALSQSDKLVWSLRSIYRLASSVSDEDSKVVDKHTTFVKRLNYIFMFLRSRWKILSRSEMIQEKESSDTNLIYDPQAFRKLFATEFSPQFAGNSQQDAHEYLTALIQQIDSSCKAIQSLSKNSCSVEKENKSTTRNLGLPCQSSLHFKMETEFECTNVFCKFKRCVVEDFFSLSLDLPLEESAEKLDIRKLMSSFSGKRERDLRCEKCKNNRVFSKTQFSSAPNILIVHLKRFSFDSERQTSSKRTDIVSVPKSLDISEFSGSARTPFRLFAIVNHFGDRAQSGHYLCDLSTSSNLWSRRNDSTESTIEENTALETASRSGYLLFYTKSNSS